MDIMNVILAIFIILAIIFVILLALKPKNRRMRSPRHQKRENFYNNYHLSQEQAERDVNCEYRGYITRPV
jgi:uncharacterized ion transporter superfamily protein YfcC